MMIGVSVLGATGSIGTSTLDVIAQHPDKYKVVGLTANSSDLKMLELVENFSPQCVAMADDSAAIRLRKLIADKKLNCEVLSGVNGVCEIARLDDASYVMASIVGAAGLKPTMEAVRLGKRILLANKESLVMSGELFMQEVAKSGAELLPIDSEHNAIFQALGSNYGSSLKEAGVSKVILTASGGPFFQDAGSDLSTITPDQAVAHPNWSMGKKISVDSATMMNKGLEVIEACWLFNASPDQIEVVVHPQSVIHSMVEYVDGSVLAQLGNPDMRTPIANAMAWPDRISSGVKSLNMFEVGRLDFYPPDFERFPCLQLAYDAIREGGTMPAVLNSANEIAVASFLEGRIGFTQIQEVVCETMDRVPKIAVDNLDIVFEQGSQAEITAKEIISALN